MQPITINYTDITNISEKGITYLKDDVEGFIDFEACYATYFLETTSYETFERRKAVNPNWSLTFEEYVERESNRRFREVGRRNGLGAHPTYGNGSYKGVKIEGGKIWIMFYTDPITVLYFDNVEIYGQVRGKMQQIGNWVTFDLT